MKTVRSRTVAVVNFKRAHEKIKESTSPSVKLFYFTFFGFYFMKSLGIYFEKLFIFFNFNAGTFLHLQWIYARNRYDL